MGSSESDESPKSSNSDSSADPSESYLDIDYLIDGLFPYDEPYENQYIGIKNAIKTFRKGGCHVLEGPCGTGKTLISVVAALSAIRDPQTNFERALVITSVKQQQQAFESDIREINEAIVDRYGHARNAPAHFTPATALTIVGKADLCPYVDSSSIGPQEISHKCPTLISNTYDRAYKESLSGEGSLIDGARKLVESAESRLEDAELQKQITSDDIQYSTIEDAHFGPRPVSSNGDTICPYFAQKIVDDELGNQTINYSGNVLDATTLRQKAAKLGTCPYTAMKDGIESAEIVIGNYAHVFHRGTVEAVTKSIVNGNTLLIVDESHMLVEKVRDYLSISLSRGELESVKEEIDSVVHYWETGNGELQNAITDELSRYGTSLSEIKQFRDFSTEFEQMIDRVTNAYLEKEEQKGTPSRYDTIPFRDPEEIQADQLEIWLEHINYSEEFLIDSLYRGKGIGSAMQAIASEVDSVDNRPVYAAEKLGQLVTKKIYADRVDYFFELSLSPKTDSSGKWSYNRNTSYRGNYSVSLRLQNCIPASDLQRTLSQFGGSLLMSATISPVDVYMETVGVDELDVPTGSDVFKLNFPEENRGSYVVGLPEYTSKKRGAIPKQTAGNPVKDTNFNVVRQSYVDVILDVVGNVEGNTMICMPSYPEAKWIGEVLDAEFDRPTYIDQSSTNDETIELKEQFEKENKAILTTSLRGTLTEGVDYSGDRLSNVIICGVPLTNPYSDHSLAIQTAYAVRFGRANAFDYSFSVPAIYKTRQAIGRVIRNSEDVGTRILVDERYRADGGRKSVRDLLSDQEQSEFISVKPDLIGKVVTAFWSSK